MTAKSLVSVLAVIGGTTVVSVLATAGSAAPSAPPLLKRGEYLVEKVGMCADCHSPRNQRGEFIREAYLGGTTLPFSPTVPMPAWAPASSPIAGLPTMTDDQAVVFLTTGKRPDGSASRPPMPEFRFSEDDARAVTAYLRSLGKKS
ncbi:MAG: c-type cytochrome [Verrucomicrobia bacterium]|nr:c-type cytochrome [Verrucomicrobiota bacterium]